MLDIQLLIDSLFLSVFCFIPLPSVLYMVSVKNHVNLIMESLNYCVGSLEALMCPFSCFFQNSCLWLLMF